MYIIDPTFNNEFKCTKWYKVILIWTRFLWFVDYKLNIQPNNPDVFCNRKIWCNFSLFTYSRTNAVLQLQWSQSWCMEQNPCQLLGCYTRLIRKALDVSWQSHTTNKDLYGNLLPNSVRLRSRRLILARQCFWRKDKPSSLVATQNVEGDPGTTQERLHRKDYIISLTQNTPA